MSAETIIAQCTPSGSGAIALLRVSGPDACSIVSHCALLSSQSFLTQALTHTIHHGWVVDKQQKKIDEVLFFVMHAPRTFTGEHTVEITCHNNQFLIEAIEKGDVDAKKIFMEISTPDEQKRLMINK